MSSVRTFPRGNQRMSICRRSEECKEPISSHKTVKRQEFTALAFIKSPDVSLLTKNANSNVLNIFTN